MTVRLSWGRLDGKQDRYAYGSRPIPNKPHYVSMSSTLPPKVHTFIPMNMIATTLSSVPVRQLHMGRMNGRVMMMETVFEKYILTPLKVCGRVFVISCVPFAA